MTVVAIAAITISVGLLQTSDGGASRPLSTDSAGPYWLAEMNERYPREWAEATQRWWSCPAAQFESSSAIAPQPAQGCVARFEYQGRQFAVYGRLLDTNRGVEPEKGVIDVAWQRRWQIGGRDCAVPGDPRGELVANGPCQPFIAAQIARDLARGHSLKAQYPDVDRLETRGVADKFAWECVARSDGRIECGNWFGDRFRYRPGNRRRIA